MIKPKRLKKGDRVAIVSLSSGMLGEDFCSHIVELGVKRLKELGLVAVFMQNALKGIDFIENNPAARASDLKDAFMDDDISGVFCAIGGLDTYRTLEFLMEDDEFIEKVKSSPKLFTGFSDSTVNHLMFYKLGMQTFYGPNFICDLSEMEEDILPYTKNTIESYFNGHMDIVSSDYWYEERKEFSSKQLGVARVRHEEKRHYEVLQGDGIVEGRLLGGCLETLYDLLTDNSFPDQAEVASKYGIFPDENEWNDKILFFETCEEKPTPEMFRKEVEKLKENNVFNNISAIIVGKPMDEVYYEEYKSVLIDVVDDEKLPILYNVNFGHALPRCALPYGIKVEIDLNNKKIKILEEVFSDI